MNMLNTIRARHSVRTYDGAPLATADWAALEAELKGLSAKFGLHLALVKNDYEGRQFGSYGMIKGAAAYIVAACKPDQGGLVDCGDAMERAVLKCTELGLGTCWLGGAFKRAEFAGKIEVGEGEAIPAVISVGKERDKPRWFDGAIRRVVKPDQRKPFGELFKDGGFDVPLAQDDSPLCQALEMVRIGPSASNKQPWRAVKAKDSVHFYEQHAKGYEKMGYDMQALDLGIAKAHFALAMDALGQRGAWAVRETGIGGVPEGCEYVVSWVG